MPSLAPTRGATEHETTEWAGRPLVARTLRAAAFLAPILASWLTTRATSSVYWRPAGVIGLAVWAAQLVVVGSAVVVLVGRASRRLLPLAALYSLSIAFPDRAPSRFRVALRAGNVRNVQASYDDLRSNGFGADRSEAMARILEMVAMLSRHEPRTRGHTDRVRAFSDLLGEEMGLGAEERDKLRWAAMLHDIGKLSVPAAILNKAGRPTEEEWATLVRHPVVGGEIVEELADWLGEWRFAASQHHERWDGTGYPLGLAGEEISRAGRIVAVADAYDVITSARSYKKPMSADAARRELVRCAGTQFDPAVVRAFLNLSIGRQTARTGTLGWLLELPRGIAAVASQTAGAAGGVVAASSIAAVTAAATLAPPPPAFVVDQVAAPVAVVEQVAPSTTSTGPGEVLAARRAEVVESAPATTTAPEPVAPTTTRGPAVAAPPSTAPATNVASTTTAPPVMPAPTTTAAPPPTTVPPTTAPPTTAPPTTKAPAAPVVRPDLGLVAKSATATIDVLANDSDADGDLEPATLSITDAPNAGTATVAGGRISYTAPGGVGATQLTYRVCDAGGRCGSSVLTIVWG